MRRSGATVAVGYELAVLATMLFRSPLLRKIVSSFYPPRIKARHDASDGYALSARAARRYTYIHLNALRESRA